MARKMEEIKKYLSMRHIESYKPPHFTRGETEKETL
jgi:hypothetical protein